MPKLRITQMTGTLEIKTPEPLDGEQLPFIVAGSTVRVVSGAAWFMSDNHALIQAKEGDAFRFTPHASRGAWPPSLSIALLNDQSRRFAIIIGDRQFLLRDKGEVSVVSSGPGEATVLAEGGNVQIAPGYVVAGATANAMSPGETITVEIPIEGKFGAYPSITQSLSVVRKDPTTFEASVPKAQDYSNLERQETVEKALSQWPKVAHSAAASIMEKYGVPNRIRHALLLWNDNGDWKKTVVYRYGAFHSYPEDHRDVLEQSVAYDVPPRQKAALEGMDIGLKVNADGKGISAVSQSEETNFLAINLANDVILGKMSPEHARAFYETTISLSNAGKSSRYMDGLIFKPARRGR